MADELSNLYRYEAAGSFNLGATTQFQYLPAAPPGANGSVNLSDVGLEVGDVVSVSAYCRNLVASEPQYLRLRFMDAVDGGGSLVSAVNSDQIDSQTFVRHTNENATIPAGTLSFNVAITRASGSGIHESYGGMANRGAVAAPFLQPYRGSTYSQIPPTTLYDSLRIIERQMMGSRRPFGQGRRYQENNLGRSDHYEAILKTIGLYPHEARRFVAWARNVGVGGNVALRDPAQLAPGADGVRPYQANGLVDGASQTGKSITTDGWDASVLVLSEGDWFQLLGTGQLLQADADIYSDGSGDATITTTTALRSSPADDSIVEINQPHLHAILTTPAPLDLASAREAASISLAFTEDY